MIILIIYFTNSLIFGFLEALMKKLQISIIIKVIKLDIQITSTYLILSHISVF